LRATDAAMGELLAGAVCAAGRLALEKFRTPVKSWTKANGSPVSEVDIAVDDLLRHRLRTATPVYGWLSEETRDDEARLAALRVWIVDPIDGTRAYLSGRPDWTIAAALVERGRPVLAAVFAPAENSLFTAALGEGACRNGTPITATEGASLDGTRIAGPKSQLDNLARLGLRFEAAPRVHSLALRLARVAQGALDAAFASASSHEWDLAAADLLVHEAGGQLTTLGGRPLVYNQTDPVHGALVAAGRVRHSNLIELLRARPNELA
jgi:myo-inositol-1(or 4)-monophosphatase